MRGGGWTGTTRRDLLRAGAKAGLGGTLAAALGSTELASANPETPQTDAELVHDLLGTEQVVAFAYVGG